MERRRGRPAGRARRIGARSEHMEVANPVFLKHVKISGFKSFADRVEFDFGPGITCIVGPNGCGKSNIVDAFRWVLGEQSAKSLRGRQMLDMIFNGSQVRRSSGMAQIEVVFDNRDRTLPLDCDEVSVMRKLYRSGESEYLVNKEPSRLKDIRELFMDTGIGTEAYSVIEQGKVDVLLRANPTERRAIFEEAAGISRYKARRREAERKLDRTQQNLLRVGDIIEEVERRLRSVKLQRNSRSCARGSRWPSTTGCPVRWFVTKRWCATTPTAPYGFGRASTTTKWGSPSWAPTRIASPRRSRARRTKWCA